MEQTALLAAPIIAYFLTEGVKRLKEVQLSDNRKNMIRTIAGLFSFLSVVGLAVATGTEVDASHIEGFIDLLTGVAVTFFGAAGIHEVKKN